MTERIGLRPLSPDDAPEMAKVLADPALYQYTGGTPPTVEGLGLPPLWLTRRGWGVQAAAAVV